MTDSTRRVLDRGCSRDQVSARVVPMQSSLLEARKSIHLGFSQLCCQAVTKITLSTAIRRVLHRLLIKTCRLFCPTSPRRRSVLQPPRPLLPTHSSALATWRILTENVIPTSCEQYSAMAIAKQRSVLLLHWLTNVDPYTDHKPPSHTVSVLWVEGSFRRSCLKPRIEDQTFFRGRMLFQTKLGPKQASTKPSRIPKTSTVAKRPISLLHICRLTKAKACRRRAPRKIGHQ